MGLFKDLKLRYKYANLSIILAWSIRG